MFEQGVEVLAPGVQEDGRLRDVEGLAVARTRERPAECGIADETHTGTVRRAGFTARTQGASQNDL
ncbi:hypothetical protein GCM10020216_068350 [Nonomuraea helvata]